MTSADFCAWLTFVVQPIVKRPEKVVVVQTSKSDTRLFLELCVDNSDYGRVCGKRGETIRGLRAVAAAAGGRHELRVTLDLHEEPRRR